MQQICLS